MSTSLADSLLQAARELVNRYRCSVVSIGRKKKPSWGEWKSLQKRQPTDSELCSMFRRQNSVALAVIGGYADMVGRDFDAPGSYTAWTHEQPELAASIPTVLSPGGHDNSHVQFKCPDTPTRTFDDGELKGQGSLLIMPPSIHPNGEIYRWLIHPGDGGFPIVDPIKTGLSPERKRTTGNDGRNGNDGTDGNDGITVGLCGSDIDALIEPCLPIAAGQNDRLTFILARSLRAIELKIRRELTFQEFTKVFTRWWSGNGHKPPEGREWAFDKLQRAYNVVRSPLGTKHEELAAERTNNRPLPRVASRYDDEPTRRAVALLREMQRIAGEGRSWPLTCGQLAKVLNLPHDEEAHRILGRLERRPDPVLRCVKRGAKRSASLPRGRPSTWLYLKPLDEGDTANA